MGSCGGDSRENVKLSGEIEIYGSFIGVREIELHIRTVTGVLSDDSESDDCLLRDEISECLSSSIAPLVSSRRSPLKATPDGLWLRGIFCGQHCQLGISRLNKHWRVNKLSVSTLNTYSKWVTAPHFLLHIQVSIAVDERNNHLDLLRAGFGEF